MFRNCLKIALRNLVKQKLYTLINVFGLAKGLAFGLTTIGTTLYELGFDDFHEYNKRIFRENCKYNSGDRELNLVKIMNPVGKTIEISEVRIIRTVKKKLQIFWN